ncbi:nuclear transport factor 2 family protein [Mycolicibacterium celeriflavum]|uniref:Uncharacterized protein n=1 Tax=Mycolicibacterium celeriflavum TaxID=1249101 RepID=A0A1X0BYU4_MYCCF|nr:nuclear transport factor 2 family protein [Mycolicibacterium celeriflavum]MCV7236877.1 nuclear transport factor 2 family protein [Mycolicibacterium celeriflavum]ORA49485.1 hypothetical protein BST21_06320 [Mycolicibacterium celeriflavum]BBY43876.1 hypothetical protein MCEL_21710 [Mycolicibacterium celeriflavum]
MAVIDPTRTWEPLEKRLADTTNERHRVVLSAVIEHMKAEAAPDMDRLMATLAPQPDYHFWGAEGDFGPKTTAGVQTYYTDFLATRTNILEFEVQRLVVDDHCLVTEGLLKQIYPGAEAQRIGIPVDDVDADYLIVFRQLLLWPIDENGKILGEDSYNPGVVSMTKMSREELPQSYVDLVHPSA